MGLSNYYDDNLDRFLTKEENKARLDAIKAQKAEKKRLRDRRVKNEFERQNKMFEE